MKRKIKLKQDGRKNEDRIFRSQYDRGFKLSRNPILSGTLITLVTRKDSIDEIYDEVKKKTALIAILEDRLGTMNRELDKGAALFIGLSCETPGDSVMYAYYLAHKMKQKGIGKILELEKLCIDIFPNGLFEKESLNEIWDKQKVSGGEGFSGSDNLLDYRKASESLIYE